jgi:(E)-4-hydroxy-3-methylbut-2-enyl-diphosphate synthase
VADLSQPEQLYRKLGAKLVVGMPFKDIATSDSIFMRQLPDVSDAEGRRALKRLQEVGVHVLAPAAELAAKPLAGGVAVMTLTEALAAGGKAPAGAARVALTLDGSESEEQLAQVNSVDAVVALLNIQDGVSRIHASRRVFDALKRHGSQLAVLHHIRFPEGTDRDDIVINTGSLVGGLLVDGLGDGAIIEAPHEDLEFLRTTSFGLLQGSRMRNIKTEYVSCPSCGRTLFDLQEVTEQIRQKTGHLPGVAIAVMGCIVNGPGEMADADFGYVGGAPGKIDLYVGKEVVQRGIPMEGATDALVQLIKDNGRWVDLPEPEEALEAETAVAA